MPETSLYYINEAEVELRQASSTTREPKYRQCSAQTAIGYALLAIAEELRQMRDTK